LVTSLGGDPQKKTIVWLPTWRALSSVGHFNTEIAELAKTCNVIVKVHPLMVDDEPWRVAELEVLGFTRVIKDARDNVPLYQIADVMLFDYGGPPFGAIHAGKHFVLLNVPGAARDHHTGPGSTDIELRKYLWSIDPGSSDLLRIADSELSWARHEVICEALDALYFAPLHGRSAAAAASAIRDQSWIDGKGPR